MANNVVRIPGQREGTWKYYFAGFCYHYSDSKGVRVFLKCSKKRCSGRGIMALNPEHREEVIIKKDHNHAPEMFVQEIAALKLRMLERARLEMTSLNDIFNEECAR
jgi:hypothetical protein